MIYFLVNVILPDSMKFIEVVTDVLKFNQESIDNIKTDYPNLITIHIAIHNTNNIS